MLRNKKLNKSQQHKFNIGAVSNSVVYPLAFLTRANKLFMKSKSELSADGTPIYIPNPKSSATYSIQNCMREYTPIYDRKILKQYI